MSDWNEETLRKAASWQAFKEGRGLFAAGSASGERTPGGWKGAVAGTGRRPVRVSVVARSATDLETHCICAANRATGELCAHAVATGLAVLAGGGAAEAPVQRAPTATVATQPWSAKLPKNWIDLAKRARLACELKVATGAEVSPADEKLGHWLADHGLAGKSTLQLHTDGERMAGLLNALVGHPRVESDGKMLEINDSGAIRIADVRAHGQKVELALAPSEDWQIWAGMPWQASPGGLTRVGESPMPSQLVRPLTDLLTRGTLVLESATLLRDIAAWQEWCVFPEKSWLTGLSFRPAPMDVRLVLNGTAERVVASVSCHYAGENPVPPMQGDLPGLPRLKGEICWQRNTGKEREIERELIRAGFALGETDGSAATWRLTGEQNVTVFLAHSLPHLRAIWQVEEGGSFARVRTQTAVVRPHIEFPAGGDNWFELSFQTNDSSAVSSDEVRRMLRACGAPTRFKNGKRMVVDPEIGDVLLPLLEDLDLRQENGKFTGNSQAIECVKHFLKNSSNTPIKSDLQKSDIAELPRTVSATLRDYQMQGFQWLSDRVSRYGGALLADDMGLGKTLQAIASIEHLFEREMGNVRIGEGEEDCEQVVNNRCVLVVATASLLGSWQAEFAKFAPGRNVKILHGAGRDRLRSGVRAGDVLITTYGTLARDLAWHLRQHYMAVVVDEASLMRNPATDHAKALHKINATARIALTGTPLENGVRDLWSIFRLIQPGWLGSEQDFRERYEQPLAEGGAAASVMERLRAKLSPFLLRRTKEQVASDLPEKVIIDVSCELSNDQKAVYKELLIRGRREVDDLLSAGSKGAARMQVLTTLLRLRQTSCDLSLLANDRLSALPLPRRSAKMERLFELLEEAVLGNHKVLVFSQFQNQLLEIEKHVFERDWPLLRLDGQTRNRQKLVETFQKPDGPPIFLISLKAGGYGLNLTAADIVIHFDPWWNPAAEAQATDRAHRIGQTRPVTVYRLLTRGTVEEKIVALQAKKRELSSVIDEAGSEDPAGLSFEDLRQVLGE